MSCSLCVCMGRGCHLVLSGSLFSTFLWPSRPVTMVYVMLLDHVAQPWGVSTPQLQVAFVSQKNKCDLGATFQLCNTEGLCLSHLLPRDERSHGDDALKAPVADLLLWGRKCSISGNCLSCHCSCCVSCDPLPWGRTPAGPLVRI